MNKWNGEGLPPVGEIVKVNIKGHCSEFLSEINGNVVEIVLHTKSSCGSYLTAVFRWVNRGYKYHALAAGNFLPIKSEREKAIEEMCAIADKKLSHINTHIDISYAIRSAIECFYDAGYRKKEIED